MANGNITTDLAAATASKDEDDLLLLANPMGRALESLVSDVLDEVSDVLELARVIASNCPQELVDDKTTSGALDSMLHRAHERAEAASRLAWRQSIEARRATDPKFDPYPGRISTSLIFQGVVPESVLRAFKELRVAGGELMSSEEWLAVGQEMVDTYGRLQKVAAAAGVERHSEI
jgi:hypothetical protein